MVRKGGPHLGVALLLRTRTVRSLLLTTNPYPLGCGYSTLEFAMNIELEEVVGLDVSDDALELAAGSGSAYAQVSWLNLQTHCVA